MSFQLRKNLMLMLSLINRIIPKSSSKIFFYDSTFRKDNLWTLLKFLEEKKFYDKYTIYYFTSEKVEDQSLSPKIKFINGNLSGLYHHLTAKYIFSAFGAYRFMCKHSKNQVTVNLWHGSPLKTIGILAGEKTWYPYYDIFKYTLCSSDFFKKIMISSFGFEEDQGLVLGAPRNDDMFSKVACFELLNINNEKYKKIVLWMPTFRTSEKYSDSSIDFPLLDSSNSKMIDKMLFDNKTLLIVKTHPFQEPLDLFQEKYNNIMLLTNADLEKKSIKLYQLLGQVDALLTDYSSVYFDFLLTQKPIGFVLDDIDEYGDKRGFVVENPLDLMPGEKIYNEEDFITFIRNTSKDIDNFKEERKHINDLVNKYQDNRNCERILEFLGITPQRDV